MNVQQLFAFLLAIPMTFFAAGGTQDASACDLAAHDPDAIQIRANNGQATEKAETHITSARAKRASKTVKLLPGIVPAQVRHEGLHTVSFSAEKAPILNPTFITVSGVTVRYERLSDGKAEV